jgi:hypothetical protein
MDRKNEIIELIKKKYTMVSPVLDERGRRQWAATEAAALGRGGLIMVCLATNMSHNTVARGEKEIEERLETGGKASNRIGEKGGGRKRIEKNDTKVLASLKGLVEAATCGDPMSPLCRTNKST